MAPGKVRRGWAGVDENIKERGSTLVGAPEVHAIVCYSLGPSKFQRQHDVGRREGYICSWVLSLTTL
jgi:hypothetical protein